MVGHTRPTSWLPASGRSDGTDKRQAEIDLVRHDTRGWHGGEVASHLLPFLTFNLELWGLCGGL